MLTKWIDVEQIKDAKLLQSYYYARPNVEKHVIMNAKDIIIDSGAFTFMANGKYADWNMYTEEYGQFIKRTGIDKYFEMDIDSIVGYQKVLQLRRRLEQITGKQPIPVWHKERGKEAFITESKEYPYVAFGGIALGKAAKDVCKYFPWFIDKAHENGAKIHALGFTSMSGVCQYHFDSVDSSCWTCGNRYGCVYKFNGKTIVNYPVPKGKRMVHSGIARNNFAEWVKFQKYAEAHL